jgi:hypothetical protein
MFQILEFLVAGFKFRVSELPPPILAVVAVGLSRFGYTTRSFSCFCQLRVLTMRQTLSLLLVSLTAALGSSAAAQGPSARAVPSHGYAKTIVLAHGDARAVLSPEAGGRVLEFSRGGKDAMWFDPGEAERKPSQGERSSAGRFDIGPELTTPRHPALWGGDWTGEVTGECSSRLTSPQDEATGVQLVRDFELSMKAGVPRLDCKQTIRNISDETKEYCHWGRSFSPGGGICLVPLAGKSRFPSKYAMYEDSAIINVRPEDDQIRERDGFLEILAPPRKPKLGFDSQAGWLAYAMPSGGLFVKRFKVDPDLVYSEAAGLTISVWYPAGARIELEPIGPRERLAPGETASFTEEWFLLDLPYPPVGEQIDLARARTQVEALPK